MKRPFIKLSAVCLSVATLLSSCGAANETETEKQSESISETEEVTEPVIIFDGDTIREIRTDNEERKDLPSVFSTGKGYDDLIFYETEAPSTEGKVILDTTSLSSKIPTLKKAYGSAKIVNVTDSALPFSTALQATVTTVPEKPYNFQLQLGKTALSGNAKAGDLITVSFYARCVGSDKGQVGIVIEQGGGKHDKLLSKVADVTSEWKEFRYAVNYKEGYTSVNLRLGYMEQTVEIGGFSIVNTNQSGSAASLNPDLLRGAKWREEAFKRIEDIRKGDFNIVVTDTDGNPIEGAEVDIEMFEHEFEWGCAVNKNTALNSDKLSKISSIFNSAVLENDLKWARYEQNPQLSADIIAALSDAGIDTVRGHCLIWDRVRKDNDTSVPEDLPGLYDDREAMTERIRAHINQMLTEVDGIAEWDVLNEACKNTVMQDKHGKELIAEWFSMAREADPDMKLYYNDYTTSSKIFALLNSMEKMGVDYDGIGIQSHYSSVPDMDDLISFYERLSKYGKEIKITEYDFACEDPLLQASFTRDLMILAFSHDAIEGFYLWGFFGGEGEKYVGYDKDGNPRPALTQIEDLIYNKWWTEEEGKTDSDGRLSFNGYYGSYNISVTANGTKKIVSLDCFSDSDREIRVVMP